jgi:hypothetical protein
MVVDLKKNSRLSPLSSNAVASAAASGTRAEARFARSEQQSLVE